MPAAWSMVTRPAQPRSSPTLPGSPSWPGLGSCPCPCLPWSVIPVCLLVARVQRPPQLRRYRYGAVFYHPGAWRMTRRPSSCGTSPRIATAIPPRCAGGAAGWPPVPPHPPPGAPRPAAPGGDPETEPLARAGLAISLLSLGRTPAARREIALADDRAPQAARGRVDFLHALVLQRVGELDHALDRYRRALP